MVLEDPQATIRSSIANLSRKAQVSEPTVNRFCRSLECNGFPDFKLKVAQSLAENGTPYLTSKVQADDSVNDCVQKIFDKTIASLDEARKNLDVSLISRAIDVLSQARRVEFYGVGASASVAQDAQHKFFRLNTPVVSYSDVLMQRMAAAALNRGDVAMVISYTGRTKSQVENAQAARAMGATVIGLTDPQSPLADECSIVLGVTATEDTDIYMPMVSRIIHLAIIDVLATGVTLKRGPDFIDHLKKIKESLMQTRFQKPAHLG